MVNNLVNSTNINVIQFGTGNFLRGFIEAIFQDLKDRGIWEANIGLIQSTNSGTIDRLKKREFSYPLWITGIENGKEINKETTIDCIQLGLSLPDDGLEFLQLGLKPELEFIISNVTEAGFKLEKEADLKPFPKSFPARLTLLLFTRFQALGFDSKELKIIPCELISDNGKKLLEMVHKQAELWGLHSEFFSWLNDKVIFYNTLVDRIVTGLPSLEKLNKVRPEATYHEFRAQAEPYFFFGISGTNKETILSHSKLPITQVDSIDKYSLRKVRILNCSHLAMVALSHGTDLKTVGEFMNDPKLFQWLKEMILQEVIPILPLDYEGLVQYSEEIWDRFKNPFVEHYLRDISLNTIAKSSPRVIDPLLAYYQVRKQLPPKLTEILIKSIIKYLYSPDQVRDSDQVKAVFTKALKKENPDDKASFILDHPDLWGYKLTQLTGLTDLTSKAIQESQQ